MEKPIEPNAVDCCNSGCNPCIFDIYEKQLILYRKYLEDGKYVKTPQHNGISQLNYTTFTVMKNMEICNFHNLILFKKISLDNKNVWWKPGDHFLFKYTTPESSCTRAYTPVKVKNELSDDYDFSIIVKKYDKGLVSTHLCNLIEGNVTLWRGPYGHYKLEPNKFKRILMIAQGTGIAPFISIIENILNNEDDMTKIILLYCCKCEQTILFRDELYAFKSYWNFKYDIFLSSLSLSVNFLCRYQEPIRNQKLSFEYLCNFKPFVDKDQFLLCGSSQFNKAYDDYLKKEVPIGNIVLF